MSTLVDYKPREIVDNASTARAPLRAGHVHGRRFRLNLAGFAIAPGLAREEGSGLLLLLLLGAVLQKRLHDKLMKTDMLGSGLVHGTTIETYQAPAEMRASSKSLT